MKRILFILLLLPFFAHAQELVKDSVWLTREAYETTDTNGRTTGLNWTFIRNTYFEFDDLSGRLEKLPIGDTVQARSALLGWQVDMVRQHSYHAVQAMKKGQVIADWQQVNAAMKANGLGGLDEAMQAAFEGQLIGDANVKIGTAVFVPADVVKNAQGNLRLLFGNAGYRLLPYADTMLRVVGYPATGQNTDLYKVRERVFRNVENTFTLRLR
jgi:hypothetical protein